MEKERREKEEGKKKKRRRRKSRFGNFLCDVWNFGIGITINPSLSKLCKKNPIRSVVGWYKMNFMVYFEF